MNRTMEKIVLKFLSGHDKVYQASGGRLGHKLPGLPPNLLLHSVGAKTGLPRTNTLTYAEDGANYLIVSSNGGANRYPSWYHNLKAHPEVEINVGTKRLPVTAQVVLPDQSGYQRLWQIANENNANRYANYQTLTSRPLAVIVLSPR